MIIFSVFKLYTCTVKHKIFALPYFHPLVTNFSFDRFFNLPSYNIDYTFYMRMFICPCFEFAYCQLGKMGKIKKGLIKPVLQYMKLKYCMFSGRLRTNASKNTVAALDLGGGSTQLTFTPLTTVNIKLVL